MTSPEPFRNFNGERFKYHGTRYRKSSADYLCNRLRGKGLKCRIIFGGRKKERKIRYLIYTRKRKYRRTR